MGSKDDNKTSTKQSQAMQGYLDDLLGDSPLSEMEPISIQQAQSLPPQTPNTNNHSQKPLSNDGAASSGEAWHSDSATPFEALKPAVELPVNNAAKVANAGHSVRLNNAYRQSSVDNLPWKMTQNSGGQQAAGDISEVANTDEYIIFKAFTLNFALAATDIASIEPLAGTERVAVMKAVKQLKTTVADTSGRKMLMTLNSVLPQFDAAHYEYSTAVAFKGSQNCLLIGDVIDTVVIPSEDITWRTPATHSGVRRRPWLMGTLLERQLVFLDSAQLQGLLLLDER